MSVSMDFSSRGLAGCPCVAGWPLLLVTEKIFPAIVDEFQSKQAKLPETRRTSLEQLDY
jgi:hypothetical protein